MVTNGQWLPKVTATPYWQDSVEITSPGQLASILVAAGFDFGYLSLGRARDLHAPAFALVLP